MEDSIQISKESLGVQVMYGKARIPAGTPKRVMCEAVKMKPKGAIENPGS
jgi:hypothetical protein